MLCNERTVPQETMICSCCNCWQIFGVRVRGVLLDLTLTGPYTVVCAGNFNGKTDFNTVRALRPSLLSSERGTCTCHNDWKKSLENRWETFVTSLLIMEKEGEAELRGGGEGERSLAAILHRRGWHHVLLKLRCQKKVHLPLYTFHFMTRFEPVELADVKGRWKQFLCFYRFPCSCVKMSLFHCNLIISLEICVWWPRARLSSVNSFRTELCCEFHRLV